MTNPNQNAVQNVPPAFTRRRTLLALDLGTTTGWALHGADGLITSGTASFRNGRFDGGGFEAVHHSKTDLFIDRAVAVHLTTERAGELFEHARQAANAWGWSKPPAC